MSGVRGGGRLNSARTASMSALPGAAAGVEECYRERPIPGGAYQGACGKRKREADYYQILRGGDSHEEDSGGKPESLQPSKTRKATCKN